MKRTIILLSIVGISVISFAQIKVNSSGQTLIGGTSSTINGKLQINIADGNTNGLTINNSSWGQMYRFTVGDYYWRFANTYNSTIMSFQNQGLYIGNSYYNGYGDGALNVMPIYNNTNYNTCALFVGNQFNDGSAGILCQNTHTSSGGVAIVAKVGHNAGITFASTKGNSSYNFYVKGNGEAYSKGVLLTSDLTLKKDIRELESPLSKIMQLHGVEYSFKDDEIAEDAHNDTENLSSETKPGSQTDELPKINADILEQIEKEQANARHIGFIAQEVENVLPEVVRTSIDGTKAISYMDIIALLVEGMKEQQQVIEQLQADIFDLQQEQSAIHKKAQNKSASSQALLYQNTPNPFSQSTIIGYILPTETQEATIRIYDMNGTEIVAFPIDTFGNGELTIDGGTLRAGMYLYSLIADGQLIDTKQMVLTK